VLQSRRYHTAAGHCKSEEFCKESGKAMQSG
jgi:hypothetical protein